MTPNFDFLRVHSCLWGRRRAWEELCGVRVAQMLGDARGLERGGTPAQTSEREVQLSRRLINRPLSLPSTISALPILKPR